MTSRGSLSRRAQRGLTLVELLVAMTVGLLVTLVAIGLLLLAAQGLGAVDSTADARDKERLALEQLSQIVLQAGFEDWSNAAAPLQSVARSLGTAPDPEPDLFGWDNAMFSPLGNEQLSSTTLITNGNRPGRCGGNATTSCRNGSDILAVRFQGVSRAADSNTPDGSMLDCGGTARPAMTGSDFSRRVLNVFHVAISEGATEPSLQCAVFDAGGTWRASRPLLEGVESLQVLYGTDGVQPGTPPADGAADSVADRWLRADQLTVPGNPVATRANWRRVRAVRLGLAVRGPVGSAVARETRTLHPLGEAFADSADAGSTLAASADGRLRTTRSITLHLRNDLAMP